LNSPLGPVVEAARRGAITGAKAAADASEGADIRMGRFLPNNAYIGGINLEPGNYTFTINFGSGTKREISADVAAGKVTLIDVACLR